MIKKRFYIILMTITASYRCIAAKLTMAGNMLPFGGIMALQLFSFFLVMERFNTTLADRYNMKELSEIIGVQVVRVVDSHLKQLAIDTIKKIQSVGEWDRNNPVPPKGSIAKFLWNDGSFSLGMEYGAIVMLMQIFDISRSDLGKSNVNPQDVV